MILFGGIGGGGGGGGEKVVFVYTHQGYEGVFRLVVLRKLLLIVRERRVCGYCPNEWVSSWRKARRRDGAFGDKGKRRCSNGDTFSQRENQFEGAIWILAKNMMMMISSQREYVRKRKGRRLRCFVVLTRQQRRMRERGSATLGKL